MVAAYYWGRLEVVALLIDRGANINTQDYVRK